MAKIPKVKVRIQLDFTTEQESQLDGLVDSLGAASRAEVVRRALALLEEVETLQAQGGQFQVSIGDVVHRIHIF